MNPCAIYTFLPKLMIVLLATNIMEIACRLNDKTNIKATINYYSTSLCGNYPAVTRNQPLKVCEKRNPSYCCPLPKPELTTRPSCRSNTEDFDVKNTVDSILKANKLLATTLLSKEKTDDSVASTTPLLPVATPDSTFESGCNTDVQNSVIPDPAETPSTETIPSGEVSETLLPSTPVSEILPISPDTTGLILNEDTTSVLPDTSSLPIGETNCNESETNEACTVNETIPSETLIPNELPVEGITEIVTPSTTDIPLDSVGESIVGEQLQPDVTQVLV